MNSRTTQPETPSRRKHERVRVRYPAELALDGGPKLSGHTQDLSLAGICFAPATRSNDLLIGRLCKIRLTGMSENREFSCRVVHLQGHGCGLRLTETGGAGFGAIVTDAMMQEIQIRIGMEIDSDDTIRVKWINPDPKAQSAFTLGWLVKIGGTNMEFGYPVSSGWNFKMGDTIQVELQPWSQPAFQVNGLVRMILSGDPRCRDRVNERVCVLVMPASQVNNPALRDLLFYLHSKRLKRLMTQRSTSVALQSGGDPPLRSRQESRRDLERFYGFKR